MRRLFYILFLFCMVSCAAAFRVVADLGMSEDEFTRINLGARIVEMYDNVKVYRVVHAHQPVKYVYFEEGKLVRLDEGQMLYSRWNPYVMMPEEY